MSSRTPEQVYAEIVESIDQLSRTSYVADGAPAMAYIHARLACLWGELHLALPADAPAWVRGAVVEALVSARMDHKEAARFAGTEGLST